MNRSRKSQLTGIGIVLLSMFAAHPSEVDAQCSFDGTSKAKGMKSSLIRVFAGCPSLTWAIPAPNSQTGAGTPSCAPPYAWSAYEFDSKGACSFSMKAKRSEVCGNELGPPGPCMAMTLALKCSGIVDGEEPINTPGWLLRLVVRATIDDPDNGDMTVVDVPVELPLTVSSGKLTLEPGPELLSSIVTGLPTCTQLQILSVRVLDPEGDAFATLGSGTR